MNRKLITAWVVFALVMLGVVSFMACRKTENVKGDVFGAGSLLVIIPTRTPTPIGPTPTPLPLKMTISVTKCGRGCAYGCRFSIDEQTIRRVIRIILEEQDNFIRDNIPILNEDEVIIPEETFKED